MSLESTKVHFLIVNDDFKEVETIKSWLERDMRLPWNLIHCVKMTEIESRMSGIDLIILKPEMEGFVAPKEVFKSIEGMVFEIPIIVLTDKEGEHSLSTYVMEQGAADTLVRGQFARLVDAIEFALIRQKSATDARISADQSLATSRRQGLSDQERHKQIMRMFSGDYSVDQGHS